MPILNRVHILIDVGNDRWGGCNTPLNLTIASGGIDLLIGTWTGANLLGNGHTVPANRTGAALVPNDSARGVVAVQPIFEGISTSRIPWFRDSYAIVYGYLNPYIAPIDTASLEPSSVRLSNTGANLVRPRQIVVWGWPDFRSRITRPCRQRWTLRFR